ncbi:MAG: hypothetical protein ABSF88_00950 [Candidatus Aminicenantales bacterium]
MTFIPILKIVVPLFILLVLILKSRKSSIYLVSLPLLLSLGGNIYLFNYEMRFEIFGLSLGIHDFLLALQIIAWIYVIFTRPVSKSITQNAGYKWAIGILIYYLFLIIISVPSLEKIIGKPILAFPRMYLLPVGFLVMMDTYRRYSIEEVMTFLTDLRNIVLIICILYIINAIYPGAIYEINRGDAYDSITGVFRSYTFPPILFFLALAITIGKIKYSFKEIVITGTMLTAGIFNFGRNLILTSTAVIILGRFLSRGEGSANRKKFIRLAIGFIAIAASLIILQDVFVRQYDYILKRLEPLLLGAADSSYVGRLDLLENALMAAKQNSILLGAGAYAANPYTWVMGSWDSDLYQLIIRSGLIGVGLFLLVYVYALWGSIRLMNRRTEKSFEITIISMLFIFAMFLFSLTSTNYTHYPTIATIGFVFISIEAGELWPMAA